MTSDTPPAAVVASTSPPPHATAATVQAARRPTMPAAIGFQGLATRSTGASIRSLTTPMQNCSPSIPAARRSARPLGAPASRASAKTSALFRNEGNGWTSRSALTSRATDELDVDELVEGLDQEFGELLACVGQE